MQVGAISGYKSVNQYNNINNNTINSQKNISFSGSLEPTGCYPCLEKYNLNKVNFLSWLDPSQYYRSIVPRSYSFRYFAPDLDHRIIFGDKVPDEVMDKLMSHPEGYINGIKYSEAIRPDEVDDYLVKRNKIDEAIELKKQGALEYSDVLDEYLIKHNRVNEAVDLRLQGYVTGANKLLDHLLETEQISTAIEIRNLSVKENNDQVVNYLIKNGRLNEAKQILEIQKAKDDDKIRNKGYFEKFDNYSDKIMNSELKQMNIDENGEYIKKEYDIDSRLASLSKYDPSKYVDEIENLTEREKNISKEAKEYADKYVTHGLERFAKGLFTLGYAEYKRAEEMKYYEQSKQSMLRNGISRDKEKLNENIAKDINNQKEAFNYIEETTKKQLDAEKKKEPIKKILEKRLTTKVMMSARGENIKVPNCVMITGKDPYMTQAIAKWTAETTDSDFIKINSDLNNDVMEIELLEKLKEAKKTWDTEQKRSIIFVEGMEKLLDPKQNSKRNIAFMKDLMQKADNEFHTTIMFHSINLRKLEPGTITSNRVGLRIENPLTYNDLY